MNEAVANVILNRDEQIAKQALLSLGHKHICYEPAGNVSPDFLVDGSIAVEVRRLNLNGLVNGFQQASEESLIPLTQSISNLLNNCGPKVTDIGHWINFSFRNKRCCNRDVVSCLKQLISTREIYEIGPDRVEICRGVSIQVLRSSNLEKEFRLGGYNGEGIFVESELLKNLKICVNEKMKKTRALRSNHPKWWLLLVDYVSYMDTEILEKFKQEAIDSELYWDAIWVASPLLLGKMFRVRRANEE